MRKRRFGRLAALVMALACLAMLLCGLVIGAAVRLLESL